MPPHPTIGTMVIHNYSLTRYHSNWKLHKGSASFLRLLVSRLWPVQM
jgi:hypothetical protein